MDEHERQALVFSASGISGVLSASCPSIPVLFANKKQILRECLVYPSPNAFSRAVDLTDRHISKNIAMLPAETDRWELHSGIDLEKGGLGVIVEKLRGIKDISKVTHVYFTCELCPSKTPVFSLNADDPCIVAYTAHGSDYQTLKQANVTILANAVQAVESLCQN